MTAPPPREVVLERLKAGSSVRQVAREFQVDPKTIRRLRGGLKVVAASERWTAEELERAEALRKVGYNAREISNRLGRSFEGTRAKLQKAARRKAPPRQDNPPVEASVVSAKAEHGDKAYVVACLAQGGFCALSERRYERGLIVACLPLVWPSKTAQGRAAA